MKFILLLLITLPLFSDDYRIKHPKMHSQIESDKRRAKELKDFADKREKNRREKEEAATRHKSYRPDILKHEMKFTFLKNGKVEFKESFQIRLKYKYQSVYVRNIKYKSDSLVQDWKVISLQLEGNKNYKADLIEDKVEINFKDAGTNLHEFTLNYLLDRPYTFLNREAIFFWKSYEDIANESTKVYLEFEKGLKHKYELTLIGSLQNTNTEDAKEGIERKVSFKESKGILYAEIPKSEDPTITTNFYVNIGIPSFSKEPSLPDSIDGIFSIDAKLKILDDTEILSDINYILKANGSYSHTGNSIDLPAHFNSLSDYFGETYYYEGGTSIFSMWNENRILHLPEDGFTVNPDYSLIEETSNESDNFSLRFSTIGQFVKKELFGNLKILYLYTERPKIYNTYLSSIKYTIEVPSEEYLNQIKIQAYLIEKDNREQRVLYELKPDSFISETQLVLSHSDPINSNQLILYRIEFPESKFSSPSLFKKIKYAFKNLINF